ncbi:MAG TPA: G/U mismatch-specific DNA glycosylase [Terracidiphilus sp.]|nr:G/U mismatch-specific DNA glycosylase [Terracidiphilus sp.]
MKKTKHTPMADAIASKTRSSTQEAHSIGLSDVISTSLKAIFCGINPGMRSAAVGHHFATRSNRFWRVLYLAGFTPRQLQPEEAHLLLGYGFGLTSAVVRPTVSAADLSRADFIAARPAFERKIAKYRPRYVAFLGKPALSIFLNQRNLRWGLQPATLGGSAVWLLPNPSGLNCAFTIPVLTIAYRDLFEAVRSAHVKT